MKRVLTQLCQQVRSAHESVTPLYIHGGNTKFFYGEPVSGVPTLTSSTPTTKKTTSAERDPISDGARIQSLNMTPYRGIISYEPSELVITARAGTPLSEIEQTVAEQGQTLAFEPPRLGANSTLGGCVASGLSGPRRMAAGSLSDFVLGARLIHFSGEVLSFGGEVMKNVAGYDVSRLLAGSLGTLGPIVELSIKVMPRPVFEQTRKFDVKEDEALALLNTWRSLPVPVSATAWVPDPASDRGGLYVRLSGSDPAVASATEQLGGVSVPDDVSRAFWNGLRDQTDMFFQQRPLWRVAVPPATGALGLGPTLIEWNGGLRWVVTDLPAHDLRHQVEAHGGHATLYRYDTKPRDVSVFHPLPAALARINQRMMRQFDPMGIFNPGRRFPLTEE